MPVIFFGVKIAVEFMKRIYKRLLWGALLTAVIIAAVILLCGGTTRTAETSVEAPEEKLRTRFYETDSATVKRAVEETIPTLQTYGRHWRLVKTDNGAFNGKVEAEVPVFIFADDLQVEIKREADKTVVNVHSASRVGMGDWGENRRHILQLLEVLDKNFAVK